MEWESGDIYKALREAIVGAKDSTRDPLKDRAITPQILRLTELNNHGYFNRDKTINGEINEVHGWKKIEKFHQDTGWLSNLKDWTSSLRVRGGIWPPHASIDNFTTLKVRPTNLDMEVWQKGNATVVSVLSVKDPIEADGNDIQTGVKKIQEWAQKYSNLVVVGHGDKGSTIALAAAQKLQDEGLPVPPTLAMEPFYPQGLHFKKDAPVVAMNLTANTRLNNLFWKRDMGHVTELPTRILDGSNVAGTGRKVATSWMNSIDARAYYAALGIATFPLTPDRDFGPVVTPPTQPLVVRAFNPNFFGADSRFELFNQAQREKTGSLGSPNSSYAGLAKERLISPAVVDPPAVLTRTARLGDTSAVAVPAVVEPVVPAVVEPPAQRAVQPLDAAPLDTSVAAAPPVQKPTRAPARIDQAQPVIKAATPPIKAKTKIDAGKPHHFEAVSSRASHKPVDAWQSWGHRVFTNG